MGKEIKNIPKHIASFINGLELKPISEVMKAPPEERFDCAAIGDQLELAGVLYKGFSLIGLKEELGHGQYRLGLLSRNIDSTGAWRAQSIAALSLRVGASNFSALKHLPATKLAMMVKWDDSELNTFFAGNEVRGITYEDAVELPSRELDRRLKEAQRNNNELEQALDKVNQENAKLQEQIKLNRKKQNSLEGFNYPLSVERVRIESSVLSAQIVQSIDDMEQLAVELTQASDLSKEKKKQEAEFSAGASSLYLNLKAVHSKSAYLMKWFAETFGEDYLPDKPEDVPSMTLEEAEKVHSLHRLLLAEARLDRDSRESQRKTKRKKAKK